MGKNEKKKEFSEEENEKQIKQFKKLPIKGSFFYKYQTLNHKIQINFKY
jgi:hypothetical protein